MTGAMKRAKTGRAGLKEGEVVVRIGDDTGLKLDLGNRPDLIKYVREVEHFGWGIRSAGFDSENICRALLGMPLDAGR